MGNSIFKSVNIFSMNTFVSLQDTNIPEIKLASIFPGTSISAQALLLRLQYSN
jgi:hypothetical protein